MKKTFLIFLICLLTLAISVSASAAYDVSKRARIGIKYGSTAVENPVVSSTTGGFLFSMVTDEVLPFGSEETKKVKVLPLDSYLVVISSYLESFDAAKEYCKSIENTVPYLKDGIIYVVFSGLYTAEDASLKLEETKAINETAYIIEPDKNLIKICNADDKEILLFLQTDSIKLGISAENDGLMDFGNQETYRDTIEFIRKDMKFNLISNLTMQHYLYSVVPAEIGASAPLEAQKAQAVCARTYYEENLTRHKADGFSLCSTTHCQMYIGTKWERAQSNKAVDETENMIITYGGKPISAVYFAHSGGVTANVEDVWGNPYPYLKSVEDRYCTDYTWEVELDYEALTKKMKDKGYSLGDITNIKIEETSSYGLVTKLVIEGTEGKETFLREKARNILGLKSQNFSIPMESVLKLAKTKLGNKTVTVSKVLTKDGVKEAGDSISVIDGSKNVTTLTKKKR